MARLPRAEAAGWPHLVRQQAHDGGVWLRDDQDRVAALADLKEAALAQRVRIHAYALERTQLWLLVTPDDDAALGRFMQAFGRRYVGAFNRRHGRSGTLWAGRYRAVIVDPARTLLDAMALVERHDPAAGNEVLASSRAHHLGQGTDAIVADHAAYWALGNTPFDRHLAWRHRLEQGLGAARVRELETAVRTGWAMLSAEDALALGQQIGRRLVPAKRGRPKRRIRSDPNL